MKKRIRHKGIVFNILFTLYAFCLQNPLVEKIDEIKTSHQSWITMAFLLFFLSGAEGLYLPFKIKDAYTQLENKISPNSILVVFLPVLLFRMIIGMGIAAIIFHLITPEIIHKSAFTPVGTSMALLIVLKEVINLFVGFSVLFSESARMCREWVLLAGDCILLAYSCVGFTFLSQPGVFFSGNYSREMVPLIFVCFLAFLQSLRLGFFVEEFGKAKSLYDKLSLYGSLVLAAGAATWSFVV